MKRYIKSAIRNINEESYDERDALAADFTLPKEILQKLAEDPELSVKANAQQTLENIRLGEDVLQKDLSKETLEKWSYSMLDWLRYYTALHPNCPIRILRHLSEDEDIRVAKAATERLKEIQG